MNLRMKPFCLAVTSLFVSVASHADDTSNVGRVPVEGSPGGTDTGLIQQEETPKARSSISLSLIHI